MFQHFLFRSDHRTYYVDFNSIALFLDPAFDIHPAPHCRLHLNDPRLVQQYQSLLHQQLSHHKVLEKVLSLQKHATENTWTDKHKKIYQNMDSIIMEAMCYVESKLGKR